MMLIQKLNYRQHKNKKKLKKDLQHRFIFDLIIKYDKWVLGLGTCSSKKYPNIHLKMAEYAQDILKKKKLVWQICRKIKYLFYWIKNDLGNKFNF